FLRSTTVTFTGALAKALAAFSPAKPAPMTTTRGLVTCCVIGNIVASLNPTYTAEGKSFIGPTAGELESASREKRGSNEQFLSALPDCLPCGSVLRCSQ